MSSKKANDLAKSLVKKGIELGADDIIMFEQKDIVYDPRTYLKCLFGCGDGRPYCPSGDNPLLTETYTNAVSKYKWGILIRTGDLKKGHEITLELERLAFLAGNQFALGFTECVNCDECEFAEGKECANPDKVRLPFYAAGIDVYSTVRGLGWELEILTTMEEKPTNITAVFVD